MCSVFILGKHYIMNLSSADKTTITFVHNSHQTMQCHFEHFRPSFHKHSLNIFEYSWTFTNILNKLKIVQPWEESKSYGDSCRCWYEQEYKWKNLSNSTSGIFKDRCYVENLITFFLLKWVVSEKNNRDVYVLYNRIDWLFSVGYYSFLSLKKQ